MVFTGPAANKSLKLKGTVKDKTGKKIKDAYFGVINYTISPGMIVYSGNDFGNDILATNDFGCIITGYTNAYGNGKVDMFLLKLDRDLNGKYELNDWD